MELSITQKMAVYAKDDKVIVTSAAGSGKTRCLTERVKYLIQSGVDVSKICAITFTNMAAQEMQERLSGFINENCFIGTIHSLANQILRMNEIDTSSIIEEENFELLFERINDNIDCLVIPEFDHLLIDEFQDICENEYLFMTETLKPKNFYAVGDSRQAIYSFKGSNYKFFMDMLDDPFTGVYELNDNYRSAPEIIDFSNSLLGGVRGIHRTKIIPHKPYGGCVDMKPFALEEIYSAINNLGDYKDWFVLTRTNAEVDEVMRYLNNKGIPCTTFKKADKSLTELREELNKDIVKVLTIHSAKGLEAKFVVVVGAKSWNDEEKRISYVAATRAEDYLLWLYTPRGRRAKVKPYNEYDNIKMADWS